MYLLLFYHMLYNMYVSNSHLLQMVERPKEPCRLQDGQVVVIKTTK